LRSGTSPAPNYGEARGAESKRDFIHKLGIVLKELNESKVWLLIIVRSEMLPISQLNDLIIYTMNVKNSAKLLAKASKVSVQE